MFEEATGETLTLPGQDTSGEVEKTLMKNADRDHITYYDAFCDASDVKLFKVDILAKFNLASRMVRNRELQRAYVDNQRNDMNSMRRIEVMNKECLVTEKHSLDDKRHNMVFNTSNRLLESFHSYLMTQFKRDKNGMTESKQIAVLWDMHKVQQLFFRDVMYARKPEAIVDFTRSYCGFYQIVCCQDV